MKTYQSILNDLYSTASSASYACDMQIYNKLTSLLALIMEESWHPENQENISAQKRDMLENKDYIDNHYTEKITLEYLADHFYISKHYLARCFKEQCGMTVVNYIQQVRITRAKHLLRFSGKTVEAIADACIRATVELKYMKAMDMGGIVASPKKLGRVSAQVIYILCLSGRK